MVLQINFDPEYSNGHAMIVELLWNHISRAIRTYVTSVLCVLLLKHTQLTRKIQTTLEANQNMVINGAGHTCWAPGLCQCYSQLKNDTESVNASKMCILMTDGALYGGPNGCDMDVPRYTADTGDGVFEKDNTRISTEFCDELYNDWSTEQGTTNAMTHRDVSTFVKSKGISIYGIGVGLSSGSESARDVFDTASCSDYTFGHERCGLPLFC